MWPTQTSSFASKQRYSYLTLQHRDLSMSGAVEMLVGVVEGLLFLHAHGWLHAGISSHALHLVSTNHAKLGSFQHAIQQQAKVNNNCTIVVLMLIA